MKFSDLIKIRTERQRAQDRLEELRIEGLNHALNQIHYKHNAARDAEKALFIREWLDANKDITADNVDVETKDSEL